MIKVWTKRELAQAIELRLKGRKWAEIADILGRSESALWVKLSKLEIKIRADGRDESAIRENLLRVYAELLEAAAQEEEAQTPQPTAPKPEESVAKTMADTTVEEDMAETRRRISLAEARESKRKYQEVLEQRAVEDRLVDVFRERLQAFVPSAKAPDPVLWPVARIGKRPESAMILISDLHIGQCVSSSQTLGHGGYNPRIFTERLYYMQEKAQEVLAQAPAGIDELHVALLGDIVHGSLNHGAEKEDNAVIADQFQLAVWCLHQFLCALAFRVPRLKIITVVGNHGRWPGQHRMPTKNRFSNLDHLVYASLQLSLKVHGLTNIVFDLNDAPKQVVDIKGSRFVFAHGDQLKGGDKQFSIPVHAMTRDVNATLQRFAANDDRGADYFIIGDKHKAMSLPLARGEYIVNGSMVGNDEFGMNFCPGEPSQLMFGIDEILRKTWTIPLKVSHAPRLPACPYHLPPQIQYLVETDQTGRLAA